MLRRVFVAAAVLAATVFGSASPQASPVPGLQHEVLAFYYGWYTPLYGNGDWTKTMRWTAAAGPYNSWDSTTVARQVKDATTYGINVFVASWWPGRGGYTDQQFAQYLLPGAAAGGIKASVLVEDIQGSGATRTPAQIISDLEYILSSYGKNPAFFTVNGRPVIFIYTRVINYLSSAADWNTVINQVTTDYPGTILLCDIPFGYLQSPIASANWAGQFLYAPVRYDQDASLPDIEARLAKADQAIMSVVPPGRIAVLTAHPGYDDSETTRPPPRPIVERYDGGTFRATLRAAIAANPDWIALSTYNEWVEGTQIEPSVQFGTQALVDAAALVPTFMKQPLRAAMQ